MTWSPNPLALAVLAGIVVAASTASGFTGYKLGRASGDRDVRRMHEAGQKALVKRQSEVIELRGKSREDADRIASLSRNARVRICPEPRLPAGGDGPDADPAGDGAGPGEDIAPILRQCLRTFGEVNRALAKP